MSRKKLKFYKQHPKSKKQRSEYECFESFVDTETNDLALKIFSIPGEPKMTMREFTLGELVGGNYHVQLKNGNNVTMINSSSLKNLDNIEYVVEARSKYTHICFI